MKLRYYEKLRDADKKEVYCYEMRCVYNTSIKIKEDCIFHELFVCELQNSVLIELFCPYGYKIKCFGESFFYTRF